MARKELKFSADMRDVRFQADAEREAGLAEATRAPMVIDEATGEVSFTIEAADHIVATCRRRWMKMLAVQTAVVAAVSGWLLFTRYDPGLAATPFEYMMGHIMTAAVGISIGFCGLGSFDHHRLGRTDGVVAAMFGQFSPVAAGIGWAVSLLLFWRFLLGWSPAHGAFFVSNPFGLLITGWVVSLAAMRWLIPSVVVMLGRLRAGRLAP